MCGNPNLVEILDLGVQSLTGVFPKKKSDEITSGPLVLTKCFGGKETCGLVQLKHSYEMNELYGDNYGYRSGLNVSMVKHLHGKVKRILEMGCLQPNDVVIDIGSNDSTTLQAYPPGIYRLVGIDPTAAKFKSFYPPHVTLLADFFSPGVVRGHFSDKVKVITSFSMFYDLEEPLEFMRDVHDVLDEDGMWVFEQSYMPKMLATNSFDTVCHEHLEFYALAQIKWATDRVGFKVIDVEFNDVNGGSFSVTVAKRSSRHMASDAKVAAILREEEHAGLGTLQPFVEFSHRINKAKSELLAFIGDVKRRGKSIYGLGASTKGNVLLQYCGITKNDIECIGEVNSDKFGSFTPGTLIPIIPEDDLLKKKPDYLLVLPWHFRSFFEANKKFSDVTLVFPLPKLELVGVRDAAARSTPPSTSAKQH
jgi:hypothetical protein